MATHLADDRRERTIESIRRYALEVPEDDLGDLEASMLLEFVLRESAPAAYNQAIADACRPMHERVEGLDGVRHEPEFTYWER